MAELWWLIHKDLTRELRTYRFLPGAFLLGIVLVVLLASQIDLPVEFKEGIAGGLLWSAILFAGTLVLEPSFTYERENGCWETLLLYPATPSVLFLAKMTVNFWSISVLELLLIPLFVALTDVPLLSRPGAMVFIAGLNNLGFAAVGTLVGAATAQLRNRSGLVAALLIPLLIPVVLASASATRLMLTDELDHLWWRWIQLLGLFGIVFAIGGAVLFEYVIEDN
jgi:heme exporter protein B